MGVQGGLLRCRRPVSAGAVPLGLGLSMNMAKRGTVPVRDETGRFTGVRPKTAAERLQVGVRARPRHADGWLGVLREQIASRLVHFLQPQWRYTKLNMLLAEIFGLLNAARMRGRS